MTYSGDDGSKGGIWQEFVSTNGVSGFSVGNQIKVVLTIDGGTPEAQTKVVT